MTTKVLLGYEFSTSAQRYRDLTTGRFVARRDIETLLNNQVDGLQTRLANLTTAYVRGEMAPAFWESMMRQELNRAHLQNLALAKGGFDRLTEADYGRADARVARDLERVANLGAGIADGSVSLAQALNRVRGYVGNARITFFRAEREELQAQTLAEGEMYVERRVLGAAEHCADCLEYAAMGWRPLGDLPVPGEGSECGTFCKCELERKKVNRAEFEESTPEEPTPIVPQRSDEKLLKGEFRPDPATVEAAGRDADEAFTRIAEEFNTTPDEVEEYTTQVLHDIIDGRSPIIYAQPGGALGVMEDGRFKSIFETGTSGGIVDTNRRAIAEFRGLGLSHDLDPRERPIYAVYESYNSTASSYGPVEFVLSPAVNERATFTVGDSLDAFESGRRVGVPASKISKEALTYETAQELFERDTVTGYVEAQIFGGVSFDDVIAVNLRVHQSNVLALQKIEERLIEQGIDVQWIDEISRLPVADPETLEAMAAAARSATARPVTATSELLDMAEELATSDGVRKKSLLSNSFVPDFFSDVDRLDRLDDTTWKRLERFIDDVPKPTGDRTFTATARAAAERATVKAAKLEPPITDLLTRIADDTGAEMFNLDYRLKGVESAARKISTDVRLAANTGIHLSDDDAAEQISDYIRYTMIAPERSLVSTAKSVIEQLADLGYEEYKFKNYWKPGNPYRGYNTIFVHKQTGLRFELQFHTATSSRVKERGHLIYELTRVLPDDDEVARAWWESVSSKLWSEVDSPDGWESLPGRII